MVQTKITAKEYLLIVFYSIEEIKRKNSYLEKLIEKQAPKDVKIPVLDKIGKGTHSITSADTVCKKIIEIQNEIIILKNRITETSLLIDKLKKAKHKIILTYRYIYGLGWEEISNLMRVNKQYIFWLHREALKEFEKILY